MVLEIVGGQRCTRLTTEPATDSLLENVNKFMYYKTKCCITSKKISAYFAYHTVTCMDFVRKGHAFGFDWWDFRTKPIYHWWCSKDRRYLLWCALSHQLLRDQQCLKLLFCLQMTIPLIKNHRAHPVHISWRTGQESKDYNLQKGNYYSLQVVDGKRNVKIYSISFNLVLYYVMCNTE